MLGMIIFMILAGYIVRRMMFRGMGGFAAPWLMGGLWHPWGMGWHGRRPPMDGMGPMGHGPGMGPRPRR